MDVTLHKHSLVVVGWELAKALQENDTLSLSTPYLLLLNLLVFPINYFTSKDFRFYERQSKIATKRKFSDKHRLRGHDRITVTLLEYSDGLGYLVYTLLELPHFWLLISGEFPWIFNFK